MNRCIDIGVYKLQSSPVIPLRGRPNARSSRAARSMYLRKTLFAAEIHPDKSIARYVSPYPGAAELRRLFARE
jgi:hypothetical protein